MRYYFTNIKIYSQNKNKEVNSDLQWHYTKCKPLVPHMK